MARPASGDPSVFSAMVEQTRRLDAAGVPHDVCPGVPAFAAALRRELVGSYGPDFPAAVVAYASREHEIVLRGRLDGIAAAVRQAGIVRTAGVIVGPAPAAEQFPDSHLYSATRCRA